MATAAIQEPTLENVSIDLIVVEEGFNSREHIDPAELEGLAATVADFGVLQTLRLRPAPGGRFKLVAGERRYRAAKAAGRPTVPAMIGDLTDGQALRIQLIDEAYGLSDRPDTLGDYFETWTERHPRAERTNDTYNHRIGRVADVEVEGIALRDWPLFELRRRHTLALVDHMLTNEGRATTGAVGILRSLSAMAEDAITDEVSDLNPFKGEEEAPLDPGLQLRGDAPLRQGGGSLRGNGPHLHRHRNAPRRDPAPPPRRLRRRNPPSPPHRPRGPRPRGH